VPLQFQALSTANLFIVLDTNVLRGTHMDITGQVVAFCHVTHVNYLQFRLVFLRPFGIISLHVETLSRPEVGPDIQ
jgi:hypothetical protein